MINACRTLNKEVSYQHIAIRLPNWLGDVCMVMPILRALQKTAREHNPEVKFSFLVRPQFVQLLEKLGVDGQYLPLPEKNWRYFFRCRQWRVRFDAHILFTNSLRSDIEAWLIGSRQRFAILRHGQYRPLINEAYVLHRYFDEEAIHQTHLWQQYMAHFGLLEDIDYKTYSVPVRDGSSVGLICGSANAPEKRWPIEHWQQLLKQLVLITDRIVLLGTLDDELLCAKIAHAVNHHAKVVNLAGKTSLAELVDVMRQQRVIIGNDTGGLHLANMMGVNTIGLYGPTNPVRTKPIHNAPLTIVQPEKNSGQAAMDNISVDSVLAAVNNFLV